MKLIYERRGRVEGKTFFLFLCKVGDKTPLLLGCFPCADEAWRDVAGPNGPANPLNV